MIVAGIWPIAAAGLCAVLGIFGLVLGGYVIVDASAGQVTVGRMLSHLPVLAGLILAVVVFRRAQ
ncbi:MULTISPECIES: hypothetical protein [Actinomycetes]|uniref:hypothetical protein n=1 Tax=Actinomycetes TaxID=1760 RepID=UPI0018CC1F99|nr:MULTISPECIES: hypothetical protein [Actinomycetes]MCK0515908.1 hypothetical protein [Williamsia sp. DF01-3]